jgi:hypothetical protein
MSTLTPIDPGRRTPRERERDEEEKRRRDIPALPTQPRRQGERPAGEPEETEEDWSRPTRKAWRGSESRR